MSQIQMVLHEVLKALWLLFPAFCANMAPSPASKFNLPLGIPINEGLFGENKTYRGFAAGLIAALIALVIQFLLQPIGFFSWISTINYETADLLTLSVTMGIGALLGDLAESFIKRRLHMKSGTQWPVFDQIDFVIGALVCSAPLMPLTKPTFITFGIALLISPPLTLLTSKISYAMKLKKTPW